MVRIAISNWAICLITAILAEDDPIDRRAALNHGERESDIAGLLDDDRQLVVLDRHRGHVVIHEVIDPDLLDDLKAFEGVWCHRRHG